MRQKLMYAAPLVGTLLVLDIVTKWWALDTLYHGHVVEGFAGVPMTLAFNEGIAFGLPLPSAGRWLIVIATVVVLSVLGSMFRKAERRDWLRLTAIAFVAAGAVGNLIDRLRWDRGVVDFIGPIDLGFMHWPIFNVADMAITTGAVLLGISLWREESAATAEAAAAAAEPAAADGRAIEETGG